MQKQLLVSDLEGVWISGDIAAQCLPFISNITGHELYRSTFPMLSEWVYNKVLRGDRSIPDVGPEVYGGTLRYVAPFIAAYMDEGRLNNLVRESCSLMPDAEKTISYLQSHGFIIYLVSTAYSQQVYLAAKRLGISDERVTCTPLNFSQFSLAGPHTRLDEILDITRVYRDGVNIDGQLTDFFTGLLNTQYGEILTRVNPMGGTRKTDECLKICDQEKVNMDDVFTLGDSVTDGHLEHGISMAFCATRDALKMARTGIVSPTTRKIGSALTNYPDIYEIDGIDDLEELKQHPSNFKALVERHDRMRQRLRGKLGGKI